MPISSLFLRRVTGLLLVVLTAIVAATYPLRSARQAHRAHRGPAESPARHARVPGRRAAAAEGAHLRSGRHRAGLQRRLAVEESRRRARRRQRRPRQRRRGADLLGRWQGQPGDPGRAGEGPRRARGARARASASRTTPSKCPPACRARRCSDGLAGTTKRTTRSTRCGRRRSTSSRRIRSRAASDRSPPTTSGTSTCAGRPTPRPRRSHAHPHVDAERRRARGPLCQPARSLRPHHRRQRPGRDDDVGASNGRTAAAASASPAGTRTRTGATSNQRKIMLNALLWIAKIDVPAQGVVDTITAADLTMNLDEKPVQEKIGCKTA